MSDTPRTTYNIEVSERHLQFENTALKNQIEMLKDESAALKKKNAALKVQVAALTQLAKEYWSYTSVPLEHFEDELAEYLRDDGVDEIAALKAENAALAARLTGSVTSMEHAIRIIVEATLESKP